MFKRILKIFFIVLGSLTGLLGVITGVYALAGGFNEVKINITSITMTDNSGTEQTLLEQYVVNDFSTKINFLPENATEKDVTITVLGNKNAIDSSMDLTITAGEDFAIKLAKDSNGNNIGGSVKLVFSANNLATCELRLLIDSALDDNSLYFDQGNNFESYYTVGGEKIYTCATSETTQKINVKSTIANGIDISSGHFSFSDSTLNNKSLKGFIYSIYDTNGNLNYTNFNKMIDTGYNCESYTLSSPIHEYGYYSFNFLPIKDTDFILEVKMHRTYQIAKVFEDENFNAFEITYKNSSADLSTNTTFQTLLSKYNLFLTTYLNYFNNSDEANTFFNSVTQSNVISLTSIEDVVNSLKYVYSISYNHIQISDVELKQIIIDNDSTMYLDANTTTTLTLNQLMAKFGIELIPVTDGLTTDEIEAAETAIKNYVGEITIKAYTYSYETDEGGNTTKNILYQTTSTIENGNTTTTENEGTTNFLKTTKENGNYLFISDLPTKGLTDVCLGIEFSITVKGETKSVALETGSARKIEINYTNVTGTPNISNSDTMVNFIMTDNMSVSKGTDGEYSTNYDVVYTQDNYNLTYAGISNLSALQYKNVRYFVTCNSNDIAYGDTTLKSLDNISSNYINFIDMNGNYIADDFSIFAEGKNKLQAYEINNKKLEALHDITGLKIFAAIVLEKDVNNETSQGIPCLRDGSSSIISGEGEEYKEYVILSISSDFKLFETNCSNIVSYAYSCVVSPTTFGNSSNNIDNLIVALNSNSNNYSYGDYIIRNGITTDYDLKLKLIKGFTNENIIYLSNQVLKSDATIDENINSSNTTINGTKYGNVGKVNNVYNKYRCFDYEAIINKINTAYGTNKNTFIEISATHLIARDETNPSPFDYDCVALSISPKADTSTSNSYNITFSGFPFGQQAYVSNTIQYMVSSLTLNNPYFTIDNITNKIQNDNITLIFNESNQVWEYAIYNEITSQWTSTSTGTAFYFTNEVNTASFGVVKENQDIANNFAFIYNVSEGKSFVLNGTGYTYLTTYDGIDGEFIQIGEECYEISQFNNYAGIVQDISNYDLKYSTTASYSSYVNSSTSNNYSITLNNTIIDETTYKTLPFIKGSIDGNTCKINIEYAVNLLGIEGIYNANREIEFNLIQNPIILQQNGDSISGTTKTLGSTYNKNAGNNTGLSIFGAESETLQFGFNTTTVKCSISVDKDVNGYSPFYLKYIDNDNNTTFGESFTNISTNNISLCIGDLESSGYYSFTISYQSLGETKSCKVSLYVNANITPTISTGNGIETSSTYNNIFISHSSTYTDYDLTQKKDVSGSLLNLNVTYELKAQCTYNNASGLTTNYATISGSSLSVKNIYNTLILTMIVTQNIDKYYAFRYAVTITISPNMTLTTNTSSVYDTDDILSLINITKNGTSETLTKSNYEDYRITSVYISTTQNDFTAKTDILTGGKINNNTSNQIIYIQINYKDGNNVDVSKIFQVTQYGVSISYGGVNLFDSDITLSLDSNAIYNISDYLTCTIGGASRSIALVQIDGNDYTGATLVETNIGSGSLQINSNINLSKQLFEEQSYTYRLVYYIFNMVSNSFDQYTYLNHNIIVKSKVVNT